MSAEVYGERTQLAVVIPAYKAKFLGPALDSLCRQGDPRFHLYVCDDGSPEPLRTVYERRVRIPNATFHRFNDNLGGRSLVAHWNRCVARTRGEPWVWLFSDDDLADPGCVAAFYQAIAADTAGQQTSTDVYRFNTVTIDEQDALLRVNPPHPTQESGAEFIYHKLTGARCSYAPEHLFSRAAFDRCGGFVDFPFAIGSDDASWVAFAGTKGLRTIAGPRVYWRLGRLNTSRLSGEQATGKLLALLDYTLWLQQHFADAVLLASPTLVARQPRIADVAMDWFLTHLGNAGKFLSRREANQLVAEIHLRTGLSRRYVRAKVYQSNWRYVTAALRRQTRRLFPRAQSTATKAAATATSTLAARRDAA